MSKDNPDQLGFAHAGKQTPDRTEVTVSPTPTHRPRPTGPPGPCTTCGKFYFPWQMECFWCRTGQTPPKEETDG